MYNFFDTETTGFLNKKAPLGHITQPRIVQLAALLTDKDGNELARMNRIIKPEGWTIPAGAASIHGITTERALAEGVPLKQALEEFEAMAKSTHCYVAHNYAFDRPVIVSEQLRTDFKSIFPDIIYFCTMLEMTPICCLQNRWGGHKWPKLGEAYEFLFKKKLEGAHDAFVDLNACKEIFFWLMTNRQKFADAAAS